MYLPIICAFVGQVLTTVATTLILYYSPSTSLFPPSLHIYIFIMPIMSAHGTILNSNANSNHGDINNSQQLKSNHTTASTTEPNASHKDHVVNKASASDLELVIKKKCSWKQKPKLSLTATPMDNNSRKYKHFTWSNYLAQNTFLKKQFNYILVTNSEEHRQNKDSIKKKFPAKFDTLGGGLHQGV